MDVSAFGEKIKTLLDEREMSIASLAKKIGMRSNTLWRKLNQEEDPQFSPETILKISKTLDVPIGDLLEINKILSEDEFIETGKSALHHLNNIKENVKALERLLGLEIE